MANPTTSSHPRLSSAEPPLGFGQLHLGAQVQGSQASVPLQFRLVGSMLLLQAVWIFLGPNSLRSWQPVSGLCSPHCAHLSLRSMTCGIGHVRPCQASVKPSVSALLGGWPFNTLQAPSSGSYFLIHSQGAWGSSIVIQIVCVFT